MWNRSRGHGDVRYLINRWVMVIGMRLDSRGSGYQGFPGKQASLGIRAIGPS